MLSFFDLELRIFVVILVWKYEKYKFWLNKGKGVCVIMML